MTMDTQRDEDSVNSISVETQISDSVSRPPPPDFRIVIVYQILCEYMGFGFIETGSTYESGITRYQFILKIVFLIRDDELINVDRSIL